MLKQMRQHHNQNHSKNFHNRLNNDYNCHTRKVALSSPNGQPPYHTPFPTFLLSHSWKPTSTSSGVSTTFHADQPTAQEGKLYNAIIFYVNLK
jgi:hypothetical protein